MGKLGEMLAHPGEVLPMAKVYLATKEALKLPNDPKLAFCYDILNKVSRSFAVVIQQLPNPLRDSICVFYLVLRALDTVEDDMAIPVATKLPALRSFHEKIYDRGFKMECGAHHYQRLMAHFGIVVDVFLNLDEGSKAVITDITKRMGHGMADFIEKEVERVSQYDHYCHYVAGLVGIGLSELFVSSGLEAPDVAKDKGLANHMGLFLQKTNIIRDYLEDILEEPAPRMFWPREIWGQYASRLDEFKDPANRAKAVECLNHMVMDALQHFTYSVAYMSKLRNKEVFRFCAIPQIMAAGTLSLCYNNGKVFEGAVKMRRGQTACVFNRCANMHDLYTWFIPFLDVIQNKVCFDVHGRDKSREDVLTLVATYKEDCVQGLQKLESEVVPTAWETSLGLAQDLLWVLLAGLWAFYAFGIGGAALPPPIALAVAPTPHFAVLHQVVSVMFLAISVHGAVFTDR